MPDYAAIARNTLASIRKAGATLTIKRPVGTVDKITGQRTAGTDISGTIVAVTLPLKKSTFSQGYDVALKEGTAISNWRAILAAADGATFAPELMDELTFEGSNWTVKALTTLAPAGLPLLHKLAVVRK